MNSLYHFIFIVVTIFVLIKTIFYGIYEINTEKNKSGGIGIIIFSILVVVFSILMIFIR